MTNDEPLAYFITWTVYGTYLQGDERYWTRRRQGEQIPQPRLVQWHKTRLNHPIILLDDEQQQIVNNACRAHCELRGWKLWTVNARTNHVHAVVSGEETSGKTIRDQLKAYATRSLRESWGCFKDRPTWTRGGDWRCINTQDDLEAVCFYVDEAQDRKDRGK
jgi:REP element-mobilizing transposase RayT